MNSISTTDASSSDTTAAMPAEIVKQQYIALVKLFKIYRSGTLDRNILKASHDFCKNLYATAKAQPDLIFAQPQLYKPQLPYVVNLAFNSAVLTCLVAVRNKFDPSVTIQLMCGSLSIYALEQATLEKYNQTDIDHKKSVTKTIGQKNSKFAQLLKTNQQNIWLCNYQLCSYIHLNTYPRTSLTTPISALSFIANKLALLCTPNKHKQPISFALAIKDLSLKCCPKWYALIIPLLRYPSVSPPGSYLRLRDGSIQIVLSISVNGLITKPLPSKQPVAAESDKLAIQLTHFEQVIQNYPCQQLNSFNRLSQWRHTDLKEWLSNKSEHQQITAFDSTLPMQAAPASLLVVQDQLNHVNANIAVIVKAIENEPDYAHQLQISASVNNRQKQPIQNSKQCLAMLGFERANSILLQHSLMSRLNQQYFPIQQRLVNFSQYFVFIARTLADETKLVSPELASTTANFVVSRLFTLPAVRTLIHWSTSTSPSFEVASLVKVKNTDSLKNDAFLLANAWQQNEQILDVLQHYDLIEQSKEIKYSTRQLCYLIGFGLILAQEHYFSETTRSKETALYFKAGLVELGINQAALIDMMNNIATRTNVYCELA
jgi:hypothetical protein